MSSKLNYDLHIQLSFGTKTLSVCNLQFEERFFLPRKQYSQKLYTGNVIVDHRILSRVSAGYRDWG